MVDSRSFLSWMLLSGCTWIGLSVACRDGYAFASTTRCIQLGAADCTPAKHRSQLSSPAGAQPCSRGPRSQMQQQAPRDTDALTWSSVKLIPRGKSTCISRSGNASRLQEVEPVFTNRLKFQVGFKGWVEFTLYFNLIPVIVDRKSRRS